MRETDRGSVCFSYYTPGAAALTAELFYTTNIKHSEDTEAIESLPTTQRTAVRLSRLSLACVSQQSAVPPRPPWPLAFGVTNYKCLQNLLKPSLPAQAGSGSGSLPRACDPFPAIFEEGLCGLLEQTPVVYWSVQVQIHLAVDTVDKVDESRESVRQGQATTTF